MKKNIEIGSEVYVEDEGRGKVVGWEEYGPGMYSYIVDLSCGGTVQAAMDEITVERAVMAPTEKIVKIISDRTAEATERCRMPTLPGCQWLFIDIDKGDQFYIVSKDDGCLVLEGRQHGDFVQFSTYGWENGLIDELSEACGRDVYYENEAFLNGETVTIVGCQVKLGPVVKGKYDRFVTAKLSDGRVVDPKDLIVRPTVLGDLASVDCGL